MQKTKMFNRIVVAVLIFSMMAVYGSVPMAKAASLSNAKDTLSTSAPSVLANHTVTFTTNQAIPADGYILVTLDANFGDISTGACSNGGTLSTTTDTIRCTYGSGLVATSTNSITISNVTNSAVGSRDITIETKQQDNTVIENAGLKVAIVSQVTMSASVPASLTFTVSGTTTGTTINGVATTEDSTATTTSFGTLSSAQAETVGQTLSVSTNASAGFKVTVQQDKDMTNAGGATIDTFKDGVASTTPLGWASPTATLDATSTYGHMGLTSDDATLSTGADFSASKYVGLDGTTPFEVMYHNGPADGTTASKGRVNLAYTVRISDLQEAGDYSNTLTYICTPTY